MFCGFRVDGNYPIDPYGRRAPRLRREASPFRGGRAWTRLEAVTRTGLACICALRETAQIDGFASVRTGSCTAHRAVRT